MRMKFDKEDIMLGLMFLIVFGLGAWKIVDIILWLIAHVRFV
jgi:hypothetical protein